MLLLAFGSAFVFGLVLTSPPMVSTADGCSGSPSYPVDDAKGVWETLDYVDGQTLPKDTVLVLRGKRRSLGNSTTGLSVNVKDSSGQPIPGNAWVEAGDGDWPVTSHVVWQPNALLKPGTTYSVDWNVKLYWSVSGTTTFVASDSSSSFPELVTTAAILQRTNALTGKQVMCETSHWCEVPPFGTVEVQPYGMRFTVKAPSEPYTYQALSIREVPGKGTLLETYDTPPSKRLGMTASPWLSEQEFSVWFAEELPEYCVNLVQRDLRNGATKHQEVCVTRVALAPVAGTTLTSSHLGMCSEPPNASLVEPWCEINYYALLCKEDAGAGSQDGSVDAVGGPPDGSVDPADAGTRVDGASGADADQFLA